MKHLQISHDYVTTRVQWQEKDKLTPPPPQGINFPSAGYGKALPEGQGAGSSQGSVTLSISLE